MARKQNQRTIIGRPLTPQLLYELNVLHGFPPPPPGFDPAGSWKATYRIWACHGYHKTGNKDVGLFEITSKSTPNERIFQLHIRHQLVQVDGFLHQLDARLWCRRDTWASPVAWQLTSRFLKPDGQPLPALTIQQSARIENGTLKLRTNQHLTQQQLARTVTSNWSLFEAIQRLDFTSAALPAVDMLEGLSILKPQQRISYQGPTSVHFGNVTIQLHRFVQLGPGILPTEYWLDPQHRLLLVTSMNKVYVLDDQAQTILQTQLQKLRSQTSSHRTAGKKR